MVYQISNKSLCYHTVLLTYLAYMGTAFGLLMGLQNRSVIFQCLISTVFLASQLYSSLHSRMTCYAIQFTYVQGLMVQEAFATCMLAHIACIMYYSNKLKSKLPIMKLMQQYTIYIVSVLELLHYRI